MIISCSNNPIFSIIRVQSKTEIPKSLSPIISFDKSTILSHDFFQIDALDLAPRLLGKFLRRDDVVLRITEVEAYRPNNSACHGRFGITARTAHMGWKRFGYVVVRGRRSLSSSPGRERLVKLLESQQSGQAILFMLLVV